MPRDVPDKCSRLGRNLSREEDPRASSKIHGSLRESGVALAGSPGPLRPACPSTTLTMLHCLACIAGGKRCPCGCYGGLNGHSSKEAWCCLQEADRLAPVMSTGSDSEATALRTLELPAKCHRTSSGAAPCLCSLNCVMEYLGSKEH